MNTSHLSENDIQRLVELSTNERRNDEAFRHLYACTLCKERFRNLEFIHEVLSRQQIEPADEKQVERVMTRVRSARSESLMIPLLQRFAYVVAMILVLGIIGVFFYQFNIVDLSELRSPTEEATGIVLEYYRSIQIYIASLGQPLADMYNRIFGLETFPVLMYTVLLLLVLAALDRWLLSPLLRQIR